jgi:hypothetical protein
MRNLGLGLALVACAQITLLSSPAFADNASNGPAAMPVQTAGGQAKATEHPARPADRRTGWVVLGVGGALTIAGIVLEAVGATQGTVAGAGGPGDDGNTSNARTNFVWGGTALIIAGIVTGIVGGSMIVTSSKSSPPAQTAPAETASGGGDGATRTLQAAYQSAPAFSMPLLGATF